MRSSGTKDCKEGRALLERESSTFRVVSLKAPVRKILIRILVRVKAEKNFEKKAKFENLQTKLDWSEQS